MNRKSFFKKLFVGAAAVVVAPKILAEVKPEPIKTGGFIPSLAKEGYKARSHRNRRYLRGKDWNEEVVNLQPNHTPLDELIRLREQHLHELLKRGEISLQEFLEYMTDPMKGADMFYKQGIIDQLQQSCNETL